MSIEQAIENIENLGDDSYKQKTIFANYIQKIKDRLLNNRESMNINNDIY